MKILVVDDDEKAVKYMSAILENAGFDVIQGIQWEGRNQSCNE